VKQEVAIQILGSNFFSLRFDKLFKEVAVKRLDLNLFLNSAEKEAAYTRCGLE
jgi:hypothetical protein